MKVLSISTDRKLFEQGSDVLNRSLMYAAKMQELHVIVFSLKSHNLEFKKIDNLYVHCTNSQSRWFYFFDALRISKKIIIREGLSSNSTVVTCQDPFEAGLVGYFLKKKFHLPLQLQIHTDFLSPYFKNNFLNRIRVFIASFTIPKADRLRVVSSVVSESVEKKFPALKEKIDVLPIFVDVSKIINSEIVQDIPIRKDRLEILMISRFSKEKRIDIGLEALKIVNDKHNSNLSMLLVGSGSEKNNLNKKIEELNISNNVKVLEWQDDVIQLYKTADIFLLTSEYEGYGMTLIEAGASGCPIVTTNVGLAQTNLFKDGFNSYVCRVGDVECLANKLDDLITNEEKRKLFKQRMQDSVRSMSISRDEYVVKYIDLLRHLINK